MLKIETLLQILDLIPPITEDCDEVRDVRMAIKTEIIALSKLHADLLMQVREVYHTKGLVQAVLLYRKGDGSSLQQAKDVVKSLASQWNWVSPN